MTDRPDHRITKDGSSTFYSNTYKQYYHNPNGSVSESKHVFFETPGVTDTLASQNELTILEVGFGTGLNFFLLLDYYLSKKCSMPVRYYSIEAFPITQEEASKLNYASFSDFDELRTFSGHIFSHLATGMNTIKPLPDKDIELHLFIGTFDDFSPAGLKADFIFHDAFSPEVNAELWTAGAFQKLKTFSAPDAVLSTYCAASKARAAMAKAGWYLARSRGALGKREMTIASLSDQKLASFKRVNEKRLIERFLSNDFEN